MTVPEASRVYTTWVRSVVKEPTDVEVSGVPLLVVAVVTGRPKNRVEYQ